LVPVALCVAVWDRRGQQGLTCRDGPPARKSTIPTFALICGGAICLQILGHASSEVRRHKVASGATALPFTTTRLRFPLACVTADEVAASLATLCRGML
jgi:hypothetical protein